MELQSGLIMLDASKRPIMYDNGDVGEGVLVVAGSRLGPRAVNEGSGLCGWLTGILGILTLS